MSFFFFNDTATTEIYTLSLHDALPIYHPRAAVGERGDEEDVREAAQAADRRLSSRAASASRGRACGASPPWAPPPRGSRPGSGCGGSSHGGTPRRDGIR